jgi:hypothetical protein
MSKVEDLALEALDWYAPKGINEQVGLVYTKAAVLGMFKDGYRQAEKDLELTWKDIMKIETLCFKVDIRCDLEARYQEVLKRFKEMKKIDLTI